MNKKGKLGVSLISSLIAMGVSLCVSFFLTPFLISNLGKEVYSFFPLANNFVGYMNIVSIALNSMASRFITISLAAGDIEKSKGYYSSVFYSNVVLCGILLVPMIIIVGFLERFLDIPVGMIGEIKLLFALLFLSLLIQLLFSVFGVATFAKERMELVAYQNIGQNVLRSVLYVGLFRIFPTTIVIMGGVTCILSIYNGFFQLFFSKKLLPDYRIQKSYFNKTYVSELLSSGGWNSLNNIGTSLLQTMMLLMANMLISVTASGDLSIVQTLPNLMTTIISTIYGVLLPRIANVYASGDSEYTINTTISSQKILSAMSVVPVIIIVVMGEHFFSLWVPVEDAANLQVLSIVTVAPLLVHSSMWLIYGLNVMNNKVKWPAIVFLIAGVLNVVFTTIVVKCTSVGLLAVPLISGIINILYYLFFIPIYSAVEMGGMWYTFYPSVLKSIIFGVLACALGLPICKNLVIDSWFDFIMISGIIAVLLEMIYCLIIFDKKEKIEIVRGITTIFHKKG